MKKHLKKSNKGFSLVELIVVIAIMAVLIGIIAPAFLKYVQKSKKSADDTNCDTIRKAVVTVLSDTDLEGAKAGTFKINGGKELLAGSDDMGTSFTNLLKAAFPDGFPKVKNDKQVFVVKITGDTVAGFSVDVKVDNIEGVKASPAV